MRRAAPAERLGRRAPRRGYVTEEKKTDHRDDVHVYPTAGREHEVKRECWCEPREIEPNLILHKFREVA